MNDLYDLINDFRNSTKWYDLWFSINRCMSKGMSGNFGNVKLLSYNSCTRIMLSFYYKNTHVLNLICDESDWNSLHLRDVPNNIVLACVALNTVLLYEDYDFQADYNVKYL